MVSRDILTFLFTYEKEVEDLEILLVKLVTKAPSADKFVVRSIGSIIARSESPLTINFLGKYIKTIYLSMKSISSP